LTKIFENPWLRLPTLLALAAAGVLAFYAQGAALDSYSAACPAGHSFVTGDFLTGGPPAKTARLIAKWFGIAILPVLLVRRSTTVKASFVISVLILLAALFNFAAAHTVPYECVTMGGDYEDHSSGTFEFLIAYFLLMPLSYIIAVADLLLSLYQGISASNRR
jgi:hypothetical protein